MSKSIGSSNPFGGSGEEKSFDNVLTGLLGSGNISKESVSIGEQTAPLSEETADTMENMGVYGTLIEALLNVQVDKSSELETPVANEISEIKDLKNVLENLPQNLNENLEEKILQYLSEIKDVDVPEEFTLIKEKLINLFKDNKLLPEKFLDKIFSEENIKDLSGKEKAEFTSILGKEILNILKDVVNKNVSQGVKELTSLKDLVQKYSEKHEMVFSDNKNLLNQEESKKTESLKEVKAEVNSQNNQSGEIKTGAEQAQDKGNLSFQKSLDENINKLTDAQKLQEKVEPRNLPKYIENQIKNSFKTGEAGYREITVKINPEHLGKLTLKISATEDSEMTVKIVAESRNIKEFLDTNISTLRNNLESSGIRNGAFNIEVDFEKNFNHFNGSNQNFSGNSNRKDGNTSQEHQSFEEKIESIFNNSGGLEVFA
jgi:hypothetical protein